MRTFTLVEGTSDKFWHIDVANADVTVHYGRAGTKGQTKTTSYADAAEAQKQADKQIAAKVKKGYVEGASGGSLTPATPAPAPAPAPAAAPAGPPAPAATTSTAPATTSVTEPATRSSSADDGDWGPDGLGLQIPRVVAAAFPGGTPVDPEPDDLPFSTADEAAWCRAHALRSDNYFHRQSFGPLRVDGVPAPERARWWNRFAQGRSDLMYDRAKPLPLAQRIAFAGDPTAGPDSDTEPLGTVGDTDPWMVLASRLALTDPAATLASSGYANDPGMLAARYVPALRALVLPHLQPGDLESWRGPCVSTTPRSLYDTSPGDYQELVRSALVGSPEEHLELVRATVASGILNVGVLESALFAVDSPSERSGLLRASGLLPTGAVSMRNWLWLIGAEALEFVSAGINQEYFDKVEAESVMGVLTALVHGPAAVSTMAELVQDHRVGGIARAWLVSHPRALAASDAGFTGAQRSLLNGVVRESLGADPNGFPDDIHNPTVAAIVAELRAEADLPVYGTDAPLPAWWDEAAAAEEQTPVAEGKIKIPAKLPTAALPPVVIDQIRLTDDMVQALLWSAVRGANDAALNPRPLVAAAREAMSTRDRDAVGTGLLDVYLAAGGKSADRALFLAAGYLGSDGFAHTLAPLVREWPGQSQHQRAVLGLDVLAATGTSTALQAISGIANKSKFKGVQKAAQESLAKLAAIQGLTVGQLEDRVVPDGGLDERGQRIFDYGPRRFRASLSPQGKAVIRDLDDEGRPTGKPRTSLPAANSKDDAGLAAAAKADFTVFRKQLTELAKIQTARLERAMVTGRTWDAAEHAELLVSHPVLNSLIRPLVWGVLREGRRVALVRVTEERDYVTVDDEPYEVPADAVLTLAHPVGLSAEELESWRTHLVDYELIAPIEQLDRAVFALEPDQAGDIHLAGLPTGSINPGGLASTLERLGWRRGNPADAGVVNFLYLPFETLGVAVVIGIEPGLWSGMVYESGEQQVQQVLIGPVEQPADLWYVEDRGQTWFDWTTADPVVVSETRRSLAALSEKMT
ncbi:DUF4132 domain-containing protein [Nocardioides sp. GXZ039]|uniref:DUF4132 domain-containing protein n=1 Tax=Nocardioides sp. GXZ039 TaxID=3136018 RepID=UPI0030F3F8F8